MPILKAAIEYAMGNFAMAAEALSDMAAEALSDMPPREEHELDPVTLHNQVIFPTQYASPYSSFL
jgi:hypothetical protein